MDDVPSEFADFRREPAFDMEVEFGTQKTLAYMIGEKFINFLDAAEGDTEFGAEIPAFVAEIGSIVEVTKGKLDFGPWEQIFYGEFDGRRPKRVLVKIIGE